MQERREALLGEKPWTRIVQCPSLNPETEIIAGENVQAWVMKCPWGKLTYMRPVWEPLLIKCTRSRPPSRSGGWIWYHYEGGALREWPSTSLLIFINFHRIIKHSKKASNAHSTAFNFFLRLFLHLRLAIRKHRSWSSQICGPSEWLWTRSMLRLYICIFFWK